MNRIPRQAPIQKSPAEFSTIARDGVRLKGHYWRHGEKPDSRRPVVIINPATSVISRYYFRFAEFLFHNGFDVVTYDYRGIGASRPRSLRGFNAGWIDWGHFDFDAIIDFVTRAFPHQDIHVVAHSVGGVVLGLAPSNHRVQRVVTVGAQYAYWRDYAPEQRFKMLLKWHLAMPLITFPFGYFPGKTLGWLEDTPKGVVRDWALSRPRFEDTWRGRSAAQYPDKQCLVERFTQVKGPMLALSFTDDQFGTVPAINRLLAYYRQSKRTHIRISPQSIGERGVGHFRYFNNRFADKLWRIALEWLCTGNVAENCPGVSIALDAITHDPR